MPLEPTVEPLLVSDKTAASMLGLCRSSYLKLLKSGRINVPCVKLGRRRLYSTDALRAWVTAGARPSVHRGGGRE